MSLAAMALMSHKQAGKLVANVARLPCGTCADFGFKGLCQTLECSMSFENIFVGK